MYHRGGATIKLVSLPVHYGGDNGYNYPTKTNHHTPKQNNNFPCFWSQMFQEYDSWKWLGDKRSKKRMGPIASNQLIFSTCHSTSIVNATTALPTATIPMIEVFSHGLSSLYDHWVDLHLSKMSVSCVGFKCMTRGFWQITPRLWTIEWTMTNMLQANPMASIRLTGKWSIVL